MHGSFRCSIIEICPLADRFGRPCHIERIVITPFDDERAYLHMDIDPAFRPSGKNAGDDGGACARAAAHGTAAASLPCTHNDIAPVDYLHKVNIGSPWEYG